MSLRVGNLVSHEMKSDGVSAWPKESVLDDGDLTDRLTKDGRYMGHLFLREVSHGGNQFWALGFRELFAR
ncbi:hypothetical protein A5659_13330 [Mycobacterium sp. 1165196.3]|nr:hypothetical protein A5659_13330 [Mycobacterium sp. 1165196.3]